MIEHLDYVKMELHKLIAVGEEGLVVHNDNLKADVRLARELIPELEGIIHLHVDAEQSEELKMILSEELKMILTDFAKKFKKFL